MPYSHPYKNYNEILNEITIVIFTEAMIFYTDILGPIEQELIGWNIIILFFIIMSLNMIYVFT